MPRYSEKDIQRHAGLQGIRKKPTPYIGPTDSGGLWTCVREPADNAIDQALANCNSLVHIIFDKVGYWVLDEGEGIPVGKKVFEDEQGRKEKLSTFFVVTGLTHGGANFSEKFISRGTHGVGIKATNAMSKKFKVWTYRDGVWWAIEYKDARLLKNVHKEKPPKLPYNIKHTKGTIVYFEPDLSLFNKGSKVSIKDVTDWCQLSSYLVPGITTKFTDTSGKTKTWHNKKGPVEYIDNQIKELKCGQIGNIFTYSSKEIDAVIAFTDVDGTDNVKAYTNGLYNKEGGVHIQALFDGMLHELKPYNMKKQKGKLVPAKKYTPTDMKEGVIGLINYKMAAPKFNAQTKDKLVDERVEAVALPQFKDAWKKFWSKNKGMAKELIDRASELRSDTASWQQDRKLKKKVKEASKKMSSKLRDIQGNLPRNKCELYIIEGDSAGGTADAARFKTFQATFPLKGKPLNVFKENKEKINANMEIASLLAAMEMKFGKYIFLTDADVDGDHIDLLLLSIFWRYDRKAIQEGRVFTIRSPEYKCRYKGKVYFGRTRESIYKKLGTTKVDITHLKGWAELDAIDLRQAAMDVDKRKLEQINLPTKAKNMQEFKALVDENVQYRKKLMEIEDL